MSIATRWYQVENNVAAVAPAARAIIAVDIAANTAALIAQ